MFNFSNARAKAPSSKGPSTSSNPKWLQTCAACMHGGELSITIPVRNAPLCRKFAANAAPARVCGCKAPFWPSGWGILSGCRWSGGIGSEQLCHPSAAALQRRCFRMQTLHGADDWRVAAARQNKESLTFMSKCKIVIIQCFECKICNTSASWAWRAFACRSASSLSCFICCLRPCISSASIAVSFLSSCVSLSASLHYGELITA